MTTVRSIIADAYQESRLIPLSATPEADEHEKGMKRLKTIIRSLFGHEMGENLQDVEFGSNGVTLAHTNHEDRTDEIVQTFLPINVRLIANLAADYTVYLPPSPADGCRIAVIDASGNFATNSLTLVGNGRKIESATSLTLATNSINREWFYRADLADWVRVEDIDDNSDSPFPEEFDDLLITMLAMRLNPSFGSEMTQESIAALNRSKSQFRSRYKQSRQMVAELGLWPHMPGFSNPDWMFNKGLT